MLLTLLVHFSILKHGTVLNEKKSNRNFERNDRVFNSFWVIFTRLMVYNTLLGKNIPLRFYYLNNTIIIQSGGRELKIISGHYNSKDNVTLTRFSTLPV